MITQQQLWALMEWARLEAIFQIAVAKGDATEGDRLERLVAGQDVDAARDALYEVFDMKMGAGDRGQPVVKDKFWRVVPHPERYGGYAVQHQLSGMYATNFKAEVRYWSGTPNALRTARELNEADEKKR